MKKTITAIAFFVVLLFSVSARTERAYQAAEGYKAPFFTVHDNERGDMSLVDYRGQYVLLNFWTSDNAESRIAAATYSRMMETQTESRVCLLSVNFDRSERLYREIVRRDNMKRNLHYHVSQDEASALKRSYGLDKEMQSFLLDEEGTIVAVNPTPEEVESILG